MSFGDLNKKSQYIPVCQGEIHFSFPDYSKKRGTVRPDPDLLILRLAQSL